MPHTAMPHTAMSPSTGSCIAPLPPVLALRTAWRLLAFTASLLGSLAFSGEPNWPEFRGPTGQGLSDARSVPIHWTNERNVQWKVAIPGTGWSSPVIFDGSVYLTSAVPAAGGGYELQLISVALADGKPRFAVTLFEQGADAAKIHSKNSHASPTPLVDDGKVYVHFGHMGTACVSTDGEVLWKTKRYAYRPVHGNGGSPALHRGSLLFSCDGASDPFVVALRAEDGGELWKTERTSDATKKFSFSTPLVIEGDGGVLAISPGSNAVSAFDVQTGREVWRVRYDGYSVIPRPVFAEGLIFIGTGYDSPTLLAIRPGGSGDVTDTHVAWKLTKRAPHTPSPVWSQGRLYLVSDRGVASCLKAATGEELWQGRLEGGFSASPVVAEGRVYFQSETGVGYVVADSDAFSLLASNPLNERTLASYAVGDGLLLIRGEESLYRIGNPATTQ